MKSKGFTLIELLVVVAIIGILATVVLASLGSARTRARDASIKSALAQINVQAELFKLNYDNYYGTDTNGVTGDSVAECIGGDASVTGSLYDPSLDNNATPLIESAQDNSPGARLFCATTYSSGTDAWAVAIALNNPETGTTGWCVDSSGNSKSINADFSSAGSPIGGGAALSVCP